MSVDVEIYMTGIIKFFRQNPKDLLSLVPKEKEEQFYAKIRETAFENYENGKEITLTQIQLLEICKELNQVKKKVQEPKGPFMDTKFGEICLN